METPLLLRLTSSEANRTSGHVGSPSIQPINTLFVNGNYYKFGGEGSGRASCCTVGLFWQKNIINLYVFQPGGIRRLCNILHECFCIAVSQFYSSRSWRSLISWPASFPFTQVKSWQHGEISQRLAAETGLFFLKEKKNQLLSHLFIRIVLFGAYGERH